MGGRNHEAERRCGCVGREYAGRTHLIFDSPPGRYSISRRTSTNLQQAGRGFSAHSELGVAARCRGRGQSHAARAGSGGYRSAPGPRVQCGAPLLGSAASGWLVDAAQGLTVVSLAKAL